MKSLRINFASIIIALTLLLGASAFGYDLPDFGASGNNIISVAEERKMGIDFMKEVEREFTISKDIILTDYIRNIGARLLRAAQSKYASTKNRRFTFFVVQSPEINAFAGPDGYIGINSGLILATKSEDELAGVMAHEIAHVLQRHIERSIEKSRSLSIPMTAATIAAIIIGSRSSDSNAASGAISGIIAGSEQYMLTFSRENEAEADRIGIDLMSKSGFNPKGLPGFFSRMDKLTLNNSAEIPTYLMSHPVTYERISDAENRIGTYYSKIAKKFNSRKKQDSPIIDGINSKFDLIKARLAFLSKPNFDIALQYASNTSSSQKNKGQVQQNSTSKYGEHEDEQYGYALFLLHNKNYADAMEQTESLIKNNSEEVLYKMLKAETFAGEKRLDDASSVLKNEYSKYPNYYPLTYQYAKYLLDNKNPIEARGIVKKLIKAGGESVDLYMLLEQSYVLENRLDYAYFYRAKALKLRQSYRAAVILLEQALKVKNVSVNSKAMIEDELARTKSLATKFGARF